MDPGTAMPILVPVGMPCMSLAARLTIAAIVSRVVVARRGYAIARQLRRPGAHKDTLNLGPPKIEADPQLVLVRRAGHAALSAIKQAIQLRSESTQLRQRAGSGARP